MAQIHFYSDETKQNEIYPAIDPAGIYPTTTVGFANNIISESKTADNSKFNYRTTGGTQNVIDGEATINRIMGSVKCTTIKEQCSMTVNSTSIAVTIDVATFRNYISGSQGDYTFIYNDGSWKRNNNIVNMTNVGITITGVPNINDTIVVHYIPEYIGNIVIAKPTRLNSIKFNQFNKNGENKLINYYIDDSGNVVSGKPDVSTNTYGIVWFKCLGGNTYTIFDATENPIYRVVWSRTAPTTSSRGLTPLSPVNIATPGGQTLNNLTYLQYYTPTEDGYLCIVPTIGIDNLCCHITGAGDDDTRYEEYVEDNFEFDIEYTLKADESDTDPIFPNGLYQVEEYADEINYKEGKIYKRIKRAAIAALPDIIAANYPYIYDNQYVYYYDNNPIEITKDEILNKNTNYIVGGNGTEQFIGISTEIEVACEIQYPLNLKGIIQEIARNKINILNIRNGNVQNSLKTINSVEEDNNYTLGIGAIALGEGTKAEGQYSQANGYYTSAKSDNQFVEGHYNIEDQTQTLAHIIGNGSSENPSNAHTIDWNGNAWYAGDVYVNSTSGVNKDSGSKKLITRDEVPSVYSGSIEPDDSLGNNGDLFVLIDS